MITTATRACAIAALCLGVSAQAAHAGPVTYVFDISLTKVRSVMTNALVPYTSSDPLVAPAITATSALATVTGTISLDLDVLAGANNSTSSLSVDITGGPLSDLRYTYFGSTDALYIHRGGPGVGITYTMGRDVYIEILGLKAGNARFGSFRYLLDGFADRVVQNPYGINPNYWQVYAQQEAGNSVTLRQAGVPDTVSTLGLLGPSLAALAFLRRRSRSRASA